MKRILLSYIVASIALMSVGAADVGGLFGSLLGGAGGGGIPNPLSAAANLAATAAAVPVAAAANLASAAANLGGGANPLAAAAEVAKTAASTIAGAGNAAANAATGGAAGGGGAGGPAAGVGGVGGAGLAGGPVSPFTGNPFGAGIGRNYLAPYSLSGVLVIPYPYNSAYFYEDPYFFDYGY